MSNMFERFTDRARRVMVLAQDEARALDHNYLGTEHLLLGLIQEGQGVAALVLDSLAIGYEDVLSEIRRLIGAGTQPSDGPPPFTPRAKKVVELSFREALQLGHNYISTEHLLLGLIREGEGVAAQVLLRSTDLNTVRQSVLETLAGRAPLVRSKGAGGERLLRLLGDEPIAGSFARTLSSFGISPEDFMKRLQEIVREESDEPEEGQASG